MRRIGILFVLMVFPFSGVFALGTGSLYDKSNSRKILPGLEWLFGPKSAGIHYDQRMIRAAEIAARRAQRKTTWHCWRSVKDAMLEAKVVSTRPTTPWAKQAGEELCGKYGFKKLALSDPYRAPVGAVIVYGGPDAGHVELRSVEGFVSDFFSPIPYPRPVVGIYVKPIGS